MRRVRGTLRSLTRKRLDGIQQLLLNDAVRASRARDAADLQRILRKSDRIYTLRIGRKYGAKGTKTLQFRNSRVLWHPAKDGGVEDVLSIAASRGNERMKVHFMSRELPKVVGRQFLSGEHLSDLDLPEIINFQGEALEELVEFWIRILKLHVRANRIHDVALVSSNWHYWAEYPIHLAATLIGMPSVAVHKESFRTEAQREHDRLFYSRIPAHQYALVMCYNEGERRIMRSSGSFNDLSLVVTGSPRFDRLLQERSAISRRGAEERRNIVIFPMELRAGLPATPLVRGAVDSWVQANERYLELWLEVARSRPALRFVVKVKSGPNNGKVISQWRKHRDLPPNVEVKFAGLAEHELRRAAGAVGFNTTALLDATALGVPAAQSRIGLPSTTNPTLLHDYSNVLPVISDLKEAVTWVDSLAIGSAPKTSLAAHEAQLLEDWVGNSDGQATLRARKAIDSVMGHSRLR